MKTILKVAFGWLIGINAGVLHAAEPAPGDMKALQGTWRGWVVEGKGEQPNQGIIHLQVVVKDSMMIAQRLDKTKDAALGEGSFKLSLVDQKKIIDATRTSAPGKGQLNAGIYAIDGDTLKWCVGAPNKERPSDFVTRKGQFLLILKRDAGADAKPGN